MTNCNLLPISHRFRDMADYWSNFRRRQGAPFFKALVQVKRVNSGLRNLVSRNQRYCSMVSCKGYFHILNLLGVIHEGDAQRQRDGGS